MKIRWLGAFRKIGSLQDSIAFELARTSEVAAEIVTTSSHVPGRVGLLLKNAAVKKRFCGDVWSVYQGSKLIKTRNPKKAHSDHRECFCLPDYKGFVVSGIQKKWVMVLLKSYDLPIFALLKGGKLRQIF